MNNLKFKKTICSLLIFSMFNAQVAMASGLNDMWQSNVTAGGPINTTNRSGYYGGSAVGRNPITSTQMFNFQPPHVSAGCSGYDIYMGSFSYVNKDALISQLKAIMNNAKGLLFQSAIEFISPMISGLMKDFQKISQMANQSKLNSCQIAKQGLGPLQQMADSYGQEMATNLTKSGVLPDWLTPDTDKTSAAKSNLTTAEKTDPMSGNIIWKAINNAQSEQKLAMNMFPTTDSTGTPIADLPKYQREILMSFFGTVITSVADESQTDLTAMDNVDPIQHDALLNFTDLAKGGQGKKKYLCTVGDTDCVTKVATEPVPFIDAQTYVYVMLYGDPAWLASGDSAAAMQLVATNNATPATPSPLSIVGIISAASSTNVTLTRDQLAFLDVVGNRVVSYIKKLHGPELAAGVPVLQEALEQFMEIQVALSFADAFFSATKNFTNATSTADNAIMKNVELTQGIKDRIKDLRSQQAQLENQLIATSASWKIASDYVDSILRERDLRKAHRS